MAQNDRELKIRIVTAGDPKGAREVEEALDDLTDATRAADEATESLGTSSSGGTTVISHSARDAEDAIEALERSVQQLNEELTKNKALSAEQAANLRRITAGGEKLVQVTRQQKRVTDESTKSNRNLGFAALEVSRAYEDLQYGIRGVLNNLPQLVLMLGGSAGLTAVISIAAVAATQLWSKFVSGPREAAKETRDYMEELRELQAVYEGLEAAARREADARSEAAAAALKNNLRRIDFRFGLEGLGDSTEKARIDAEKRVEIARKQLELAELESTVLRDSGTNAIELAERRRRIAEEIAEIERVAAERVRQEDERIARRALDQAKERADATSSARQQSSLDALKASGRAAELDARYVELSEERNATMIGLNEKLRKLRDDIEVEARDPETRVIPGGYGVQTPKLDALRREAAALQKLINSLQEIPKELIEAEGEAAAAKETAKEREAAARAAAEADQEAADAMIRAVRALNEVTERAEIDRSAQREIGDLNRRDSDRKAVEEQQRAQAEELRTMAEKISDNPSLAPVVSAINAALADQVLSAQELQSLAGTFRAYERQLGSMGGTIVQAFREMVERMSAVEGEIRRLKSQQGRPNF